MDKLWIISLILSTAHKTNGQSIVEVQLITKKYVERGSSVTLYCRHNVDLDVLHKVAWLRSSEHKFYEYISNRIPPYRNFSTPGAEIDLSKSNASQVTLMNLDFDATASYYCEVSIDNPIFTKESNEEHLHVIVKQTGPPRILFKKKQFLVGENLIANCTTTRAKPHPHITWLINGIKVDEKHTKVLHPYSYNNTKHNRSKSHQNNVQQSTQNKSDFNDIRGLYGRVTNTAQESRDYESLNINETDFHQFHPHVRSGFSNLYRDRNRNRNRPSSYGSIITQSDRDQFDYSDDRNQESELNWNGDNKNNRYSEPHNFQMHGNALKYFHKFRRHLNEPRTSKISHNINNIKRVKNYPTYSSSQLSIKVSALHADENGRLEISCVSTIPARVENNEQFADFKSYSVKIDVQAAVELTTIPTPSKVQHKMAAALGGSGGQPQVIAVLNFIMFVVSQCLPFSIFYSFLSMLRT